jgi:hypothetical protein
MGYQSRLRSARAPECGRPTTNLPARTSSRPPGRRSTPPGSSRPPPTTPTRPRSRPRRRPRGRRALIAQRGDSRLVTTEAELWPRFDIDGDTAEVSTAPSSPSTPTGSPTASPPSRSAGKPPRSSPTTAGASTTPANSTCSASPRNSTTSCSTPTAHSGRPRTRPGTRPTPTIPTSSARWPASSSSSSASCWPSISAKASSIRDPAPTDNAVVFEVGIGTATVSDCTEQVPEGDGAFDLETGERLDDLIPPSERRTARCFSPSSSSGDDGAGGCRPGRHAGHRLRAREHALCGVVARRSCSRRPSCGRSLVVVPCNQLATPARGSAHR